MSIYLEEILNKENYKIIKPSFEESYILDSL